MPEVILNFENYYGILIVVYVALPILFLYKARLSFAAAEYSCSIDNSRQLQGIFILIVVVHHIVQRLNSECLAVFKGMGYLSVGVFFILSGYGLAKSLQKRKDYLRGFISGKVLTLLLPFFLINFFTTLLLYVFGFELVNFFKNLFSLKLIDTTFWFVISIFIFYCFFYVSFKIKVGFFSIVCLFLLCIFYIFVCKYLGFNSWWFVSTLCFPVGVMLGFYEVHLSKLFGHVAFKVAFFILSLATIFLLSCFQEKFWFISPLIKSLFFAMSVLILCSFVTLKSFLADFVGGLSLEVYLLHMKVLFIFSFLPEISSALWMFGYLSALVASAYCFNKFNVYSASCLRKVFL